MNEDNHLVDITRHIITQMGQSSNRHELTLVTSLPHVQSQVDRGRIEQVLMNLHTNAIKYSPAGGKVEVTLQVEKGNRKHSSVFGITALAFPNQSRLTSLADLYEDLIAKHKVLTGLAWASNCVANLSRSMEEKSGLSRLKGLVRPFSSAYRSRQAHPQ